MLNFIGDNHGHADKLEELLLKLGYKRLDCQANSSGGINSFISIRSVVRNALNSCTISFEKEIRIAFSPFYKIRWQ